MPFNLRDDVLDTISARLDDIGDQLADIIERLGRLEARATPKRTQPVTEQDITNVLNDPKYVAIITWLADSKRRDTWFNATAICRGVMPRNKSGAMYTRSRCLKLARLGICDRNDEPELTFRLNPEWAAENIES